MQETATIINVYDNEPTRYVRARLLSRAGHVPRAADSFKPVSRQISGYPPPIISNSNARR